MAGKQKIANNAEMGGVPPEGTISEQGAKALACAQAELVRILARGIVRSVQRKAKKNGNIEEEAAHSKSDDGAAH